MIGSFSAWPTLTFKTGCLETQGEDMIVKGLGFFRTIIFNNSYGIQSRIQAGSHTLEGNSQNIKRNYGCTDCKTYEEWMTSNWGTLWPRQGRTKHRKEGDRKTLQEFINCLSEGTVLTDNLGCSALPVPQWEAVKGDQTSAHCSHSQKVTATLTAQGAS